MIQKLFWDSEFFGLPIARIETTPPTRDVIENLFADLHDSGIACGYLHSEVPLAFDLNQLAGGECRFVEEKLTFVAAATLTNTPSWPVVQLKAKHVTPEEHAQLENLAIASAIHSRFFADDGFPPERVRQMLQLWMRRSVNGELADQVLVLRTQSSLAGMVTLAKKGNRGVIGLLAVDAAHRGQGYGESLVTEALAWTRSLGCLECQVSTQAANGPAVRLYQKRGFSVERREFIYHLWVHPR